MQSTGMDGRELLADYIRVNPASQAKLARDAGCSESHLSLILAKKRWPSPRMAMRLSRATNQTVPAVSLISPGTREAANLLGAG